MTGIPGGARVNRSSLVVVLLLALVAGLAMAFGARAVLSAERDSAVVSWGERLNEIAAERASLVGAWVSECVRDGQTVSSFPSVAELLSAPAPGAAGARARASTRAHLTELLSNYVGSQHFSTVQVADTSGAILLEAGVPPNVSGDLSQVARQVLATRTPVVETFPSTLGTRVVFGVPCLAVPDRHVLGVVLLFANATEWLYPELLREPLPTATGENLLVRRDQAKVVSFSPFRHSRQGDARLGFPDAGVAASLLEAPGRPQQVTDYRGHDVLAVPTPVAGTAWAILAKVDLDEVFAPADRRAWQKVGTGTAAMLATLGLVFGLWRNRQARFVSEQLVAAEQIGFLNRLLRTISEIHALIIRERDTHRLLDGTCRIIVDLGGFQMAWIGQPHDDGSIEPVAVAGHVDRYLDLLRFRTDESAEGRGPTGTAIRERRAVAVQDVRSAPEMARWREVALERGYRSTAAFPLLCGDRVFGALTVHASEPGVLRDEAVELLASLALDVAYAMQVLENEAAHQAMMKDRARLEEQLQQAQKMEAVGRLAGGVAHDFNNLLTAITGYAELALVETDDPERCRRDVEEVCRAAERAGALTRQLLAFSRKQVLQPRVLDLNAVIQDVEKMLRRMIGEDIRFRLSLAANLGRVKADPGQIEQVLMNLAVNARDAMPSGGEVTIETANVQATPQERWRLAGLEPGPYVALSFHDSGVGISAEVLPHIFEPFFTTKERGKGTGLGLSTVYGIVTQSGGQVTVDSVPGKGTVFTVYLPRVDAVATLASGGQPVAVEQGCGETVLVVEDNEAVRHLVCEALRRASYQVIDAESAEQALVLLAGRSEPIHLLLTDVVLPAMTGPELARRVVEIRPGLKVLYMSGYTDTAIAPGTIDVDRDLISKPFTPAQIASRVGKVIRG